MWQNVFIVGAVVAHLLRAERVEAGARRTSWAARCPRGRGRHRALIAIGCALIAVLASAKVAYGGALLIPEHQHRLGSCPGGGACVWDCGGAQCGLGPGQNVCVDDAQCGFLFCEPGPVCDDGQSRVGCDLPVIDAFRARLVVRVDENDDLCADPSTHCNQSSLSDGCGSKVTLGLRGLTQNGGTTEFLIRKDVDLCSTGLPPCFQSGEAVCDQYQCLDCPPNIGPRADAVFLCHGQGDKDIREVDLDSGGELLQWLSSMQPLEFIKSDLPVNLQTGIPVIVKAVQTSGRFCSGPNPAECFGDLDCTSPEVCVPQAEFCVMVALLKGRCIGGANGGELCAEDSECDTANCGIDGVLDLSGSLVSDDQDLTIDSMGTCGGCPPSPRQTCETAFGDGLLVVNEKTAGKEKLIAKWSEGPELAGTDFGNPLGAGGTAYDLCVYDDGGALAGEYTIDRAADTCVSDPCWRALGKPPGDPRHKGYRYKDKQATADGALLLLLKGGAAGKSKVVAKGKNNSTKGQMALPTGAATALENSSSATVQLLGSDLFGSDAPKCLSLTLSTVLKNDGKQFKAKK